MRRIVYCDRFYCKYCESGRCLSSVLHLGQGQSRKPNLYCAEYTPSEEKFDRQMEILDKKRGVSPPDPVEYSFEEERRLH